MYKRIILLVLVTLLSNRLFAADTVADIVYTHGKVYTVNEQQPWAESFAVRGNKIIAVGKADEIKRYIGSSSKVIDLQGKLVLPGLIEEHIHPDMAAENMMNISLQPSQMSWQQQAKVIADFAKQDKGQGWVIGGTLDWLKDNGENILNTSEPSHFSTIDKLISHRPVMLWDIGGHALLLNSKAIEVLGINDDTPDPEGGVIVRDAEGKATGVVREMASNWVYETALEDQPRGCELIERGIKPIFNHLNQFGFTSISDVWSRYYMLDAYKEMADKHEMNLRVRAYVADPIEWTTQKWQEGARHAIENHQDFFVENWLNTAGVKFVLDGSAGGQTIIMVEPYEGTTDVHGGPWRNNPDYFREKFQQYDAMGLTIKSHAVGSQTIRTVLDAIEVSRNNGSTKRHSVAHTVFVHPDDIKRFSKLDVVAEFSPYFWYPHTGWDMVREELGQRRLNWAFPFKTLIDDGVHVSVGADWPVAESPNPFPEMETMITREMPGGSKEVTPSKAERVSLPEAIKAFTLGGAYAQEREEVIGSIEVGKLADFIVLDQNLFDIDTYQIHKTKVLTTVVDGRTVFQR